MRAAFPQSKKKRHNLSSWRTWPKWQIMKGIDLFTTICTIVSHVAKVVKLATNKTWTEMHVHWEGDGMPLQSCEATGIAEDQLWDHRQPVIEHFGSRGNARAPLDQDPSLIYQQYQEELHDPNNIWAPFASKVDWEVAWWAKLHGPGSNSVSDLLNIEGVHISSSWDILLLLTSWLTLIYCHYSCKNSWELNQIIDHHLPGWPRFTCEEIVVAGEMFELHSHDIIQCIKALYGNPKFTHHLVFAPEWHYVDDDKTVLLCHEMHTGKWWWETQVCILVISIFLY